MNDAASPMTALEKLQFEEYKRAKNARDPADDVRAKFLRTVLPVILRFAARDPKVREHATAGLDCLVGTLGGSPVVLVIAAAVLKPRRLKIITTKEMIGSYDALKIMIDSSEFRELAGDVKVDDVEPIEHRSDVLKVYRQIEEELSSAHRQPNPAQDELTSYPPPKRLGAMIAGGTDEMVAALSSGAFVANITTFYLEGEGLVPSPETQVLRVVPNPLKVFGLELAKADTAFRAGRYDEASAAYKRLAEATGDNKDSAMAVMSNLYAAVQRFDFTFARENVRAYAKPFTSQYWATYWALRRLAPRYQQQNDIELDRTQWVACAAWLVTTAWRQFGARQYVQCAATSYRALEAFCQIQCLDEVDPKWGEDVYHVHDELLRQILAVIDSETVRQDGRPPSIGYPLGLEARYAALRSRKSRLATLKISELRATTRVRNRSVLGHGFLVPTAKPCLQLLAHLEAAEAAFYEETAGEYKLNKAAFTFLDPDDIRRLLLPA